MRDQPPIEAAALRRANELRDAVRELLTRRGADLRYGRTLPRALREAGLIDVAAEGAAGGLQRAGSGVRAGDRIRPGCRLGGAQQSRPPTPRCQRDPRTAVACPVPDVNAQTDRTAAQAQWPVAPRWNTPYGRRASDGSTGIV